MQESATHSVSVAAAIFNDDGRVLLIKRQDNGNWEPPGGVLERREKIEDGLRREVREEIGADVVIEALTGVYKNMTHGIVALVFRCALKGEPALASEEAAAIAWHPLTHARELMTEAFAVRVLDANDWLGHPRVRAHDGVHLLDQGQQDAR